MGFSYKKEDFPSKEELDNFVNNGGADYLIKYLVEKRAGYTLHESTQNKKTGGEIFTNIIDYLGFLKTSHEDTKENPVNISIPGVGKEKFDPNKPKHLRDLNSLQFEFNGKIVYKKIREFTKTGLKGNINMLIKGYAANDKELIQHLNIINNAFPVDKSIATKSK